jgi:hypothetical protein
LGHVGELNIYREIGNVYTQSHEAIQLLISSLIARRFDYISSDNTTTYFYWLALESGKRRANYRRKQLADFSGDRS